MPSNAPDLRSGRNKRIDTLAICESVSDAWKVAIKLGPRAIAHDKTLSVGVEVMRGVPQVVLYKESK